MSPKAARKFLPCDEYNDVIGQAIVDVYRRGKFIIFMTSSGAILAHNAMSGYWDMTEEPWTFDYVEGKREATDSDVRVTFKLEMGLEERSLRYHDARMFGSIRYMDPTQLAVKLSKLGPEADHTMSLYEPVQVLTTEHFNALCTGHYKSVKELLMNQDKIAGVGNIYASETCWFAGVDPHRTSDSLTATERNRVFLGIRSVLRQALERRLDYGGLKVYRRTQCENCKSPISTNKIKGRSTYWCARCQD
jgi:formamidopyrimidine-DNA glycosylase